MITHRESQNVVKTPVTLLFVVISFAVSYESTHALPNHIDWLIDHFTVLCSVTRPLNESEAGVDLALIHTSLLFLCKSCCCNANEFLLNKRKAVRFVSKQGQLQSFTQRPGN